MNITPFEGYGAGGQGTAGPESPPEHDQSKRRTEARVVFSVFFPSLLNLVISVFFLLSAFCMNLEK